MNSILKSLFLLVPCLSFSGVLQSAATIKSQWSGDRIWIGPEYWANPLQDWRVEEGQVVALAAHDRTLHQLTHQVTETTGEFEMEVQVLLNGAVTGKSSQSFVGGFRFGIRGELDEYRHALVSAVEWMDAGIRGGW